MPAESKAQFREMYVLHKQGKITDKQLADYTKGVDYKSLPDKVRPKLQPPAPKKK